MKQLRRYLLYVFLLTGLYTSAQNMKDFQKQFRLMPQPQKIELLSDKGIPATSLQSIYLQGTATRPVLSGPLGSLPLAQKPAPGVLVLNISTDKNIPLSDEGYIVEV